MTKTERFVREQLASGVSPEELLAEVKLVVSDYQKYDDPALIAREDLASEV